MKLKLALLLIAFMFTAKLFAQSSFPFANEIRNFNHQDSLNFPKSGGILFIGSSSIRVWDDLEKRFPQAPIIKRGVGGCELSQLVKYYTPYILYPYHPKKIFIYAGENDLWAGETADSVFTNFKDLYATIRKNMPHVMIYFMSIKASPSRVKVIDGVNKANELIKGYLEGKPHSLYIDVTTSLYKAGTTESDPILFRPDMLHLNSLGYDRWQKVLEKYVH